MDEQLEIKKLERDILDKEIEILLGKFAQDVIDQSFKGKIVDTSVYARKIVAHVREQIQ